MMHTQKRDVSITIYSICNETALLRKAMTCYGYDSPFKQENFLFFLKKIRYFLISIMDKNDIHKSSPKLLQGN